MSTTVTPVDWKAAGAKRYGRAGWKFESPRAKPGPFYLLTVQEVDWVAEPFWRVGLCTWERNGLAAETDHRAFPTESAAFEAIPALLAAVQNGELEPSDDTALSIHDDRSARTPPASEVVPRRVGGQRDLHSPAAVEAAAGVTLGPEKGIEDWLLSRHGRLS